MSPRKFIKMPKFNQLGIQGSMILTSFLLSRFPKLINFIHKTNGCFPSKWKMPNFFGKYLTYATVFLPLGINDATNEFYRVFSKELRLYLTEIVSFACIKSPVSRKVIFFVLLF